MDRNLIDEINGNEDLFFLSVTDKDGVLEIAVSSAYQAEGDENALDGESNAVLKSILENSAQILPDYGTAYNIVFNSPIAYQVTDESFTVFDNSAEIEYGRLFSKLRKSSYLDYIKNTAFIPDFVGELQHYRICTVEKIVDVIALESSRIEKIINLLCY